MIVLPGSSPDLPVLRVDPFTFMPDPRRGDYGNVFVRAGIPAVEGYSFDGRPLPRWPVLIEVTVSPTGRSVHVYVNGRKIDPCN